MKSRFLYAFLAMSIQLSIPAFAIGVPMQDKVALTQEKRIVDSGSRHNPRVSSVDFSDPSKLPAVQWALFGAQMATLIVLGLTVWKTWEMAIATQQAAKATTDTVEEMRISRESASAPHIVVYLASPSNNIAEIIIENFGEGTARDIQFNISPPLQSSLSTDIGRFFETPKWLPPRSRLSHALDVWSSYFASDYPRQYKFKIDYIGVKDGKNYSDEYLLDIDSFRHMAAWGKKDLDDLVGAIEKVANEFRSQGRRREKYYSNIETGFPYSRRSSSYSEAILTIQAIYDALQAEKTDGLIHIKTRPLLHGLRTATLDAIADLDDGIDDNASRRTALVSLLILLHNARIWNDMADESLSVSMDQAISKVLSNFQSQPPSV
ncbi:MAG: hypothetical protein WCQ20_09370 [Synechococcaceae cyanobacterium ELA739]